MAKRIVKIRSYSYEQEARSGRWTTVPNGTTIETDDLPEGELERAERLGVFLPTKEQEEADEVEFSELDDTEMAEFIKEEKPTISDLMGYIDGDPDLARRVLAAEETATGGEPRKTLVESIAVVIGNDN